jgi:hypothetical protein
MSAIETAVEAAIEATEWTAFSATLCTTDDATQ